MTYTNTKKNYKEALLIIVISLEYGISSENTFWNISGYLHSGESDDIHF
jgi:hypothetical protein